MSYKVIRKHSAYKIMSCFQCIGRCDCYVKPTNQVKTILIVSKQACEIITYINNDETVIQLLFIFIDTPSVSIQSLWSLIPKQATVIRKTSLLTGRKLEQDQAW